MNSADFEMLVEHCSSCGPKLSMVKAATEAQNRYGNRPTTDKILEELAMVGRPPIKKHFPAMLRVVGCIEERGVWRYQEARA